MSTVDMESLREFRCTWGTCTKAFSRAEHLQRHALNHDESKGNNTCQRCSAVFRRKDLLDRHMMRHKEKDDEAGGEGLGILQTRKRLWRDSTGAVVAKRRQEYEKSNRAAAAAASRARNQSTATTATSTSTSESPLATFSEVNAPISPPGSSLGHSSLEPESVGTANVNLVSTAADDLWPMSLDDEAFSIPGVDSYDFLCNASWGNQAQEKSGTDLLYNDMFAPDTASSFNMPFTTPNYYSWLFDDASAPPAVIDPLGTLDGSLSSSATTQTANIEPIPQIQDHFQAEGSMGSLENFGFGASDFSAVSYQSESLSDEASAARQILAMAQSPISNFSNLKENRTSSISGTSIPQSTEEVFSPGCLPTPNSRPSSDVPATLQSRKSRKTPQITEGAREGILQLIERSKPKNVDGSAIKTEHELLSLVNLQEFCDSFFKGFNVSYPLLHSATFDPAKVDSLLLMSVLLLGATYGNKEAHLFAIRIHDTMRTQIFGSEAFTTRPILWILQTILLVECFGKSRAGQLQHDMSHLFHGLLINLIRRSDCQSAKCENLGSDVDMECRWHAEVEAEQKRRLAQLCFMWDTQHAVLFSQSLCMNAAELKLTLPWNESLWEAESAEEWHTLNSLQRPCPPYLTVLKSYINPTSQPKNTSLNALSRVLMLHGLMSVSWDLNRRDQTSLGISAIGKEDSWQSRITRSYDAWKQDFDIYSKQILLSYEENVLEKEEFQKFITANTAIYHAAQIILRVEINDLQIFAGASHIIGRPVMKIDRERSQKRVERWVKNQSLSAAKATSHAAFLLRDGIRKLKKWDAGDVFHYPWCLYLATLTCWAFQVCQRESQNGFGAIEDAGVGASSEEDDWDAETEMNALVSAMSRSNPEDLWRVAVKYRTADLPRMMAKHLSSVRWAVVQEGMVVLKGLAGRGSVS